MATNKERIEEKKRRKAQAEALRAAKAKRDSLITAIIIASSLLLVLVVVLLIWQPWSSDNGGATSNTGNSVAATDNSGTASGGTASKDDYSFTYDTKVKHHVEIEVKDYGTIKLELDPSYAPISVDNFLCLAESGFYDGLTFHRIIDGFMIQGGDPNHNGTGGSDKDIKGEFSSNGVENTLSHTRGVISMARSSDPDSASSQFFIVHEDSTFLDGEYAAFGWVTEGMDVVDAIAEAAQPTDSNGTIPYADQPVITKVTVVD